MGSWGGGIDGGSPVGRPSSPPSTAPGSGGEDVVEQQETADPATVSGPTEPRHLRRRPPDGHGATLRPGVPAPPGRVPAHLRAGPGGRERAPALRPHRGGAPRPPLRRVVGRRVHAGPRGRRTISGIHSTYYERTQEVLSARRLVVLNALSTAPRQRDQRAALATALEVLADADDVPFCAAYPARRGGDARPPTMSSSALPRPRRRAVESPAPVAASRGRDGDIEACRACAAGPVVHRSG